MGAVEVRVVECCQNMAARVDVAWSAAEPEVRKTPAMACFGLPGAALHGALGTGLPLQAVLAALLLPLAAVPFPFSLRSGSGVAPLLRAAQRFLARSGTV